MNYHKELDLRETTDSAEMRLKRPIICLQWTESKRGQGRLYGCRAAVLATGWLSLHMHTWVVCFHWWWKVMYMYRLLIRLCWCWCWADRKDVARLIQWCTVYQPCRWPSWTNTSSVVSVSAILSTRRPSSSVHIPVSHTLSQNIIVLRPYMTKFLTLNPGRRPNPM